MVITMIQQEKVNELIDSLYEQGNSAYRQSEVIEKTLDYKNIVIVDFENYQCIPTDLLHKEYIYYLFCGLQSTKIAQEYTNMMEGYDINIIETKHSGTNFVDNRISMYIGYIFGRYYPEKITLISNDIDYYEMVIDLMKHGYPIILREPSLSCKELRKRQTDFLLVKPMTNPDATKTEPVRAPVDNEVKKLIEFNNGNDVIAESRIKCYLRTVKKLNKTELKITIDKIESQCKLVETKGTEKFYKIT